MSHLLNRCDVSTSVVDDLMPSRCVETCTFDWCNRSVTLMSRASGCGPSSTWDWGSGSWLSNWSSWQSSVSLTQHVFVLLTGLDVWLVFRSWSIAHYSTHVSLIGRAWIPHLSSIYGLPSPTLNQIAPDPAHGPSSFKSHTRWSILQNLTRKDVSSMARPPSKDRRSIFHIWGFVESCFRENHWILALVQAPIVVGSICTELSLFIQNISLSCGNIVLGEDVGQSRSHDVVFVTF
jgi:hypothetical protein